LAPDTPHSLDIAPTAPPHLCNYNVVFIKKLGSQRLKAVILSTYKKLTLSDIALMLKDLTILYHYVLEGKVS
jgi:hypothetical protein